MKTYDNNGGSALTLSGFENFTQVNDEFIFDVAVDKGLHPFVSQIDTILGKAMIRVPTNCIPVDVAPLFSGIAQGQMSSRGSVLEHLYRALFDSEKPYEEIPNNTYYSNRYAFITTEPCVEGVEPVDPLLWTLGKNVYLEIDRREQVLELYAALMPDKSDAELTLAREGHCEWIDASFSHSTSIAYIDGTVPEDFMGHSCKITITAAKGTVHESTRTWEISWRESS